MNKAWWIWLSWFEAEDGKKTFIYGCMAQTHREDIDYVMKPICRDGFCFFQTIIAASEAENFTKNLNALGTVDFSFMKEAPKATFKNKRTIQQEVLGHSNVPTDVFHTLPELSDIFGAGLKEPFKRVLQVLEEELNQPFTKEYSRYFGCFEVFHLHPWLDDANPFLIDVDRSGVLGSRDVFYIYRNDEYSKKLHHAHIQFQASKEVIDEMLIELKVGEKRSKQIELPYQADSYKCWVFEGGQMLNYADAVYMSQIHLNMSPISGVTQIEDKLTEKARKQDKKLGKQAASVSGYSTQASNIDSRAHKNVRSYESNLKTICEELFPEPSQDRFYNKSVENEVNVIKRLTTLISSRYCYKAILIDPFFGADAVERLVTRLESHEVELIIITSWAKIDPDSGKRMNANQDPQKMLATVLPLIKPVLNTPLKLLNLQHKGDQAFHDRYLLLYRHEGIPQIYLLSNSINKMAGKWPFCMSLLAPGVSIQVQAYIEGLERSEDITGSAKPKVSFQWPAPHD